jgi:hypothetical protein
MDDFDSPNVRSRKGMNVVTNVVTTGDKCLMPRRTGRRRTDD